MFLLRHQSPASKCQHLIKFSKKREKQICFTEAPPLLQNKVKEWAFFEYMCVPGKNNQLQEAVCVCVKQLNKVF